jgi:sulfatase modifying factor 1
LRPNGYGLHHMIGNVWDGQRIGSRKFTPPTPRRRVAPEHASYDPAQPQIKIPRKVIKGGSHPCAPNYCRRYRPAARHAQPVDTSTSHVGFRCIVRAGRESA